MYMQAIGTGTEVIGTEVYFNYHASHVLLQLNCTGAHVNAHTVLY